MNGDWTLAWIRRTRLGGDSWDSVEVPFGEDVELYLLEIFDANFEEVLRTVELAVPNYLYTSAQQTADFGAPVWNVNIRVAQLSPVYGSGAAASEITWDF